MRNVHNSWNRYTLHTLKRDTRRHEETGWLLLVGRMLGGSVIGGFVAAVVSVVAAGWVC